MLTPPLTPPFPLAWGFSTKQEDPSQLPPRRLSQVHGTRIVEAREETQEADGQWTMRRNFRIGVRVADCVPVLLAGQLAEGPWVAAIHAGWRGSVGGHGSGDEPGILRQAVAIFRRAGGDPGTLFWALGPAIQVCHFEVGPEVLDAARKDPAWEEDLSQTGPHGRPHLDLHGFLRAQAAHMGLSASQDGSVPLCTYCETGILNSYRRGDKEGRQWGWIEIL